MPVDEIQDSPSAAIPAAVICTYPKRGNDGAESGPGEVLGVVSRPCPEETGIQEQLIHSDAQSEQILWAGFNICLHTDASESYYFNLMGEKPSVFVVCRLEQGRQRPFLVTCSYDEADAYMEVEEAVFAVPMQPEIYRWCEAFVLAHYVPEKKRKRKRDNWKQHFGRP